MITPRRSISSLTLSKESPVHPDYQDVNEAGFDLSFLCNPGQLDYVRQQCDIPTPKDLPEIAPCERFVIPTKCGSVPLILMRPKGTAHQALPVIIYLHGGGFVFGSFSSKDKFMRDMVVKGHVVLIYVDYSLSPEAKYPVAVEESYSAVLWAHQHANLFAFDRSRITLLGDSSGGSLAASTSILLHHRGHGEKLESQVLVYPVLAHDRSMYDSNTLYGQGNYLLNSKEMDFYWHAYTGDYSSTSQVLRDPSFAPLQTASLDELRPLPRTLVLTAECDILRDEGEHYARRLADADVPSCTVRMIGTVHGFMAMADTTHYRRGLSLITGFLNETS